MAESVVLLNLVSCRTPHSPARTARAGLETLEEPVTQFYNGLKPASGEK